ncbi:hypothetical protein [Cryptosporangium japonicum]|uniref:hypothetical protein n=1 Tax=Cryptosporangium japonicum TaxID=80872 RepID=UPI0031DE7FD6
MGTAVSATAGYLLSAAQESTGLTAGDVAIGVVLGLGFGLVVTGVGAGLVGFLRRRGPRLTSAPGVTLASPLRDLSRADSRIVRDALKRAEPPDDPELRAIARHEARRLTRYLPIALWVYPVILVLQSAQVVFGDRLWQRLVGGYCVVFFAAVLGFSIVQLRRARRYVALGG